MLRSDSLRVRGKKVHFWARHFIFTSFEELQEDQGWSRDGALEQAMLALIKKHSAPKAWKEFQNALAEDIS